MWLYMFYLVPLGFSCICFQVSLLFLAWHKLHVQYPWHSLSGEIHGQGVEKYCLSISTYEKKQCTNDVELSLLRLGVRCNNGGR